MNHSQTTFSTDPILQYLLEFNAKHPIEYKERFLIAPGGLQQMLDEYQHFRLNRQEPLPDWQPPAKDDIDQLLEML